MVYKPGLIPQRQPGSDGLTSPCSPRGPCAHVVRAAAERQRSAATPARSCQHGPIHPGKAFRFLSRMVSVGTFSGAPDWPFAAAGLGVILSTNIKGRG
jgi:hypothetical protein